MKTATRVIALALFCARLMNAPFSRMMNVYPYHKRVSEITKGFTYIYHKKVSEITKGFTNITKGFLPFVKPHIEQLARVTNNLQGVNYILFELKCPSDVLSKKI